jgi:hypothetical protein
MATDMKRAHSFKRKEFPIFDKVKKRIRLQ